MILVVAGCVGVLEQDDVDERLVDVLEVAVVIRVVEAKTYRESKVSLRALSLEISSDLEDTS